MCNKLTPENLLERNQKWAEEKLSVNETFFSKLAEGQQPRFLWIGCSDSRVPVNAIIGTEPGDVFVHRNIANLVPHGDTSSLAVIQYAVEALGVEHIVVAGHYNCGGVRAALGDVDLGPIDNWLATIKDVLQDNFDDVMSHETEQAQVDRLCELNVARQVRNVAKTSILQKAWRNGKKITVHGWIYGLKDGLLQDLKVDISGLEGLPNAYKLNS